MKKIGIMTDSHSGILSEEAQRLGIKVLPMPFYIGEKVVQTQTGVTTQILPGWVPMCLSWLCLTFLILLRPWTILMQ